MTDPITPEPTTPDPMTPEAVAPDDSDAMMILGRAALAELAPFGTERDVAVGDVLFRAGDATYDFFVVLEGEVEIVRPRRRRRRRGRRRTAPGRFLGELNLLTGQRAYLTARVTQPGRVLDDPAAASSGG